MTQFSDFHQFGIPKSLQIWCPGMHVPPCIHFATPLMAGHLSFFKSPPLRKIKMHKLWIGIKCAIAAPITQVSLVEVSSFVFLDNLILENEGLA